MKNTLSILGAILGIALALGTGPAWGESGSRTGDGADFLTGTPSDPIQCPPDNGPCFDPNASGQKLQVQLAATYDKLPVARSDQCSEPRDPSVSADQCRCRPVAFVRNMWVNITAEQNNLRLPFTADYLNGPPSHTTPLPGFTQPGFCLLTQTPKQVNVMISLIKDRVIPFFYNCDPNNAGSCPGFRVKAVTDFQYTTAHPNAVANPFAGGFSADITIAVQD